MQAGKTMKVAFTLKGQDLDGTIDPRFGRAEAFLIVDTDTNEFERIDNTANVEAASGAGIAAAQSLADRGVRALITGHCGPNAFEALAAAGIQIYLGASGPVRQALEQYKAGTLHAADKPDVQGHWR